MTTPQNIDGGVRERFQNLQTKLFADYELVLSTGAESEILAFTQQEIDAAVQARTKEMIETLERFANYFEKNAPQEVLNKYPEWQAKWAPNENVLK